MPKVTKKSVKKPVNKPSGTKKTKLSSFDAPVKSFRLSRNNPPFMTRRITRQTLYWLVIMVVIVCFQLWILKLQIDIINTLQVLKI